MAVAVDYYDLIGVPRNADENVIKDAVKRGMRLWRKKTEASDLSVRQEAEHQVAMLEEARSTLLTPQSRAHYDQRLSREGVAAPVAPTQTAAQGQDWLGQAREYLARGDYHSAAYAAREATTQTGDAADAWFVQSRANAGLNRLDNALYEANRATDLDPRNPWFVFHRGAVAEEMGRWDQAMGSYQEAVQMDPNETTFRLAVVGVFLQHEMPDKALPEAERAHEQDPQDETTCYYLGATLLELAERVPRARGANSYSITSREEIERMEGLLARVSSLSHQSDEIRVSAAGIREYLEKMKARSFRLPVGGCAGVLLTFILPIFLLLISFALIGGESTAGAGVILLLIVAGLIFGLYKWCWVPGWKINARMATVGG